MSNEAGNRELLNMLFNRSAEHNDGQINVQQLVEQLNETSERLRKAEKFKSDFLSNVRNEMVNPLTSILGLTRFLLEEDKGLSAELRNTTSLLYRETFHLDFQFRNILTAAEVEAGIIVPTLMGVNVRSSVEAALEAFKHRVKQKMIAIHVEVKPETDYYVSTDGHLLYLILTNLLANAIEFSKSNGEVAISLTRDKTFVHVAFRDFGPGIPEEELQWIFDRFRQVDMSSTKKYRGQGLGLAVVRGLTEILQGKVQVENASPGSIFTVSIPIRFTEATFSADDWSEILFDHEQKL